MLGKAGWVSLAGLCPGGRGRGRGWVDGRVVG